MNYELLSTAALEALIRNPRTRESQRIRIDEELRQREASRPDTGTLPIFTGTEAENAQRATSNAQRPMEAAN